MDKSKAALGYMADPASTCLAIDPAKLSPDERILLLEGQMLHMQKVMLRMRKEQGEPTVPVTPPASTNVNKDGIPIGSVCVGSTEKSPFLFYLTVEEDGYMVGITKFPSLSAAAEAVSLVRRSGWTFWKVLDGRTLKEVYRQ